MAAPDLPSEGDARRVPEPQLTAWRAFLTAHARITETLARELRDRADLPLTWYDVLVQLSEADGHQLRMQDLAERVLLSRSGLTRLIDRMEAAGLVLRAPSPDDRRGIVARMTPRGDRVLREAAVPHHEGIATHFADVVDDAEAEVLATVLARVTARLATRSS